MRGVFGLVKKFYLVAGMALIALVAPFASAQDAPIKTERYTLKVETLASGLSSPWSVALLPDGLILITEKASAISRAAASANASTSAISMIPCCAAATCRSMCSRAMSQSICGRLDNPDSSP